MHIFRNVVRVEIIMSRHKRSTFVTATRMEGFDLFQNIQTTMVVTVEVSQPPIGWLKAQLEWNMLHMIVTVERSQLPIGWLKAVLEQNMVCMVVTVEVSQLPIGWLKAVLE